MWDVSLRHFISPVFYWISVEWVSILCSGEYRIRTCEGTAIRFTVWPLWPLGKLPFAKCGCKCFFLPVPGGSLSGWPACFSPYKASFSCIPKCCIDLAQCVAGSVGRQSLRPVSASERRTSPQTDVRRTVSIRLRRELAAGLEPATCWLQISRSANWATLAGLLDREPNKSTDSLATCKMEESRTTTGVANQKTISSVWLTRWNWIYQVICDSYCKKRREKYQCVSEN